MSALSLESALLHLVIEGDDEEAERRILTEMLPGEQLTLARQADRLAHLCRRPERIRQALADGCMWSRSCAEPAAGYYDPGSRRGRVPNYDDFRGVCAQHRAGAEAAEFQVFDPPAEVKL